jgi:hypothetical protein
LLKYAISSNDTEWMFILHITALIAYWGSFTLQANNKRNPSKLSFGIESMSIGFSNDTFLGWVITLPWLEDIG